MTLDEMFKCDVDDPRLQPHEREIVRKKRLLEKVKIIRDAVLLNRGEVRGKDDMAYMWVNIREERQIYFKSLGWQLCKDPDVWSNFRRDDGTHSRGDLILYEIDKETAEALQLYDVIRGIEMVDGHSENFMTTLAKAGAPVYHPPISESNAHRR